jgi:hypothetical protein
MECLAKSVKYVRGENEETATPHDGSSLMGMKTPLIKINGNLITVANIIIEDGVSVGGTDSRMPKAAKQNEAKIVENPKTNGLTIFTPKNKQMMIMTVDIRSPKRKDASTSPRNIAHVETGAEANLSRVLPLVSNGITPGAIDVAVKNTAMPSNPGVRTSTGMFLPITKDNARKAGSSRPNTKA